LPENERMDRLGSADILLFEGFRLDRSGGGLFRLDEADTAAPVVLGSRALDLLGLLVERQGELVAKDAIMETVWPGTAVEEGNLTVQISTLRRILDQNREEGSCIQTVPGRGYRFIAPVTRVEPAGPPISVRPPGNGSSGSIAENRDPQGPSAPGQPGRMPAAAAPRDRHRLSRGIMAAVIGALGLLAVVAAGNWHLPWSREARSVPRLSVVVLPFTDLSGDPGQGYIADGVTDDLTTDLSRIADMFVISRNTAFTYRNKPVDAKRIGRELGVRYVLDGSVRRSGNQVRVNAQLIDAETDAHLWAERFDRDAGDLFALQDEITSRIAVALNLELIGTEAARPTDNPDALDYILRGRAAWAKAPTRDNYREVIGLFEHALALGRSAEPVGERAGKPRARLHERLGSSRHRTRGRADWPSLGGVAPQPACALGQRPAPDCQVWIRRSHSRIRNGDRVQSELGGRILQSRLVQALHWVDRGDDPAPGASHSP
jgi:TolB-like protein/DNA-binding winged helix-turn-helix (wHTH) protein